MLGKVSKSTRLFYNIVMLIWRFPYTLCCSKAKRFDLIESTNSATGAVQCPVSWAEAQAQPCGQGLEWAPTAAVKIQICRDPGLDSEQAYDDTHHHHVHLPSIFGTTVCCVSSMLLLPPPPTTPTALPRSVTS